MDTYNLHFERMSNLDLHPLSLPTSRLSPAKSNSSIVDQLTHHQHGKGDSAYSSFSGGSTAPDYPSPFLPDDLHPSSFNHYVKSIYHPNQVLQSDSKTMDHLYRSMEAFSNGNNSCHTNNKQLCQQDATTASMSHGAYPPPPIPARMDSFIATKNLENSRAHQHSSESLPQGQQQHSPRSPSQHYLQPVNPTIPETAIPDAGNTGLKTETVHVSWWRPQQQPTQQQKPPYYRSHLQLHDQSREALNPEYLSITDSKGVSESQISSHVQTRSPPRGTSQTNHMKHRQLGSSSCELNGDYLCTTSGNSSHFEGQRKRSHSAYDCLASELTQSSHWNAAKNLINSSIQHKGQFYFVTGVYKLPESSGRTYSASVCGSDVGSEASFVSEPQRLREKERGHSTMENFFSPLQERLRTCKDISADSREGFPSLTQSMDLISKTEDEENCRPSKLLTQSCHNVNTLEQIPMNQNRDISRHTANNPIFYCGPDRNCSPPSTTQTNEVTSLNSNEKSNNYKRAELAKKGRRQPLGDVASERINKETTPLLYHLTGANRAAFMPQKDADCSTKGKEAISKKTGHAEMRTPQGETSKNDGGEVISVACNTLDDSFKKYYKEKLKDAQSKVLRETSFKRRDLQLSWPHRIRQKPELRPTVIHSFASSQDSETSTDTLTPSVISEDTETGSVKEDARENQEWDKVCEKENGRPVNVAQPQVARIGGRKRLSPGQKKMCYSEPEKLNQICSTPSHSACRSLGNEMEALPPECVGDEYIQHGEEGLVATRRKMFETRGRALSASSLSKTNLKQMQHKALMEYMVRKTGQKVAEPQQPPQLPPPPRQRHSLGEKPFDWSSRSISGSNEARISKKKPHRPHSAGRILDSSTSSIRYAQFSAGSNKSVGQSPNSNWRDSRGRAGKSASVESLLDEVEPPDVFRTRSKSTPHAFQGLQAPEEETTTLPVDSTEISSPPNASEYSSAQQAPEGQQRVRAFAQRGKSMEELGVPKLAKSCVLSKSSEQLDTLSRHSAGQDAAIGPAQKNGVPVTGKRGDHRPGKERNFPWLSEKGGDRQEAVGAKTVQGQAQNQSPTKPDAQQVPSGVVEAGPLTTEATTNLYRPTSLAFFSQTRARSGSAGSISSVTEEIKPHRASGVSSNPPSPRGQDTSERDIKSSSSSPKQTTPTQEMRHFRLRPSISEREESMDEPSGSSPTSDSNQEVSLSCGVTTDPSMWVLDQEEDSREKVQRPPLPDDVSDDKSISWAPVTQTSETSVSPSTSASSADISQRTEGEKNPELENETSGENQEMEERGTPEGETETVERPTEKKPQWEELVESVVAADDSLAKVLYPLSNRKTALMLMEQLLSEDTLLMEEHYKKKQEQKETAESAETIGGSHESPRPTAPNNQTPEGAELHRKADVREKKRLLVSFIEERLQALEGSRAALETEIGLNHTRGEALESLVRERCLPVELERYGLFIGDLERVVSLLLCLSARLARVQNALTMVDEHTDAEEKQSLDSRHRLLCKQREDAKDLKDNLDRRENQVSVFLSRHLSAEQLRDYRRFVQTKASLLIRQKDLEERQRLGEEQLEALCSDPRV